MRNFISFRSTILLVFVIAAGAGLLRANCVSPVSTLNVKEGPAGGKITVTGRFFTDGCHDDCGPGGCPPTLPAKGVKILFVQGNRTEEIGRVNADSKFEILAVVTVPGNATPGTASLVVETIYSDRVLRYSDPFMVTTGR